MPQIEISPRRRPAIPRRAPTGWRAAPLVLGGMLALLPLAGAQAAADKCPDALITADVKSRILARHPVAGLKINVETEECVVTLKGCVESAGQARNMRKAARKVQKVKAVRDELTICPED